MLASYSECLWDPTTLDLHVSIEVRILSLAVTEGISYVSNPTMKSSALAGVLLSLATSSLAAYDLVKTYSGNSFFDSWSYYGHYDNLTSGMQLPYPVIPAAPFSWPYCPNTAVIQGMSSSLTIQLPSGSGSHM